MIQQRTSYAEKSQSVISGISNSELLHAVVGLYDVCLSELTPDVLYSTVCGRWARTILLVRDVKDVFLEFEKRRDKKKKKEFVPGHSVASGAEDVYEPPEPESSTFSCCYSDTSDSEEDESDDEEDYSKGINSYLTTVIDRRKKREKHCGPFTLSQVGPENRIVAACTFDKKYIKTGEKVCHLTLLAIRKRFRRLGLGKFLISQVKDHTVSGPHDAVVVHAESEATSFFTRCGFSDDLILNSRWSEIAEQFTNCNLLTYIPPYTGQSISSGISDIDLLSLELELRKWKDKSLEAHQSEVTIIERMKAEMIRLRAMISSQEEIIKNLKSKLVVAEANQVRAEKDLLIQKTKSLNMSNAADSEEAGDAADSSATLRNRYHVISNTLPDVENDNVSEAAMQSDTLVLATDTDQELKRYVVVSGSQGEIYDHGKDVAEFHKICEDFKCSLRRDAAHKEYTVTSVSKALLPPAVINRYASAMRSLGERPMVMKVYYSGSADHPERLEQILKDGFSTVDMSDGDYGQGIYFSRNASAALQFSPPNKVLVAEVLIGKCQTLITKDKGRQSPDKGYNSILCPGRLSTANSDSSLVQEYIIFDPSQAVPLDLIEYSTQIASSNDGPPVVDINANS
ncbi:uncharacterized protein [Watersipora subatra]|uniref:uncharacterized protein isoform X2 n=1 Tax=Watersipora subatra TaxID=2589382 RepID=UPI00355B1C4F